MVSTPERFSLGNILKSGVNEVWNDAPYRQLREALETDRPPEICRSCSLYRHAF
jgi:radical SAM protein with 4Fe4S-binding SPASM domain